MQLRRLVLKLAGYFFASISLQGKPRLKCLRLRLCRHLLKSVGLGLIGGAYGIALLSILEFDPLPEGRYIPTARRAGFSGDADSTGRILGGVSLMDNVSVMSIGLGLFATFWAALVSRSVAQKRPLVRVPSRYRNG